jgi:hypothetical protein
MRTWMALVMGAGLLAAETWTGTVVDVMCKGRDLASHTRECALQCAKGGFGLVLADGTFVKFNEAGNARTLAQLKKLDPGGINRNSVIVPGERPIGGRRPGSRAR